MSATSSAPGAWQVAIAAGMPTTDYDAWEPHHILDEISSPLDLTAEGTADEDDPRVAAWRAGEWAYIGVRARCTVYIPKGTPGHPYTESQMLSTPGLWGVESDSGADYLAEVFTEERARLIETCRALGVVVLHEPTP